MPYFTLGYKQIDYFYDEEDGSYMFPDASENARLEALRISLHANQYNVKGWDGTKTVEHYCQFSGGGDIYIAKDNLSPVLVFVVPKDSSATDEDDESPEGSSQLFRVPSPLVPGRAKLVSFTLEGKRGNGNIEDLKFQLWANMFVITITKFKESLKFFDKKQLLELKQITGYGMACSGDGIVGVFKLEMDLIETETTIVDKLELGRREILKAAALMDYALQYYKEITELD